MQLYDYPSASDITLNDTVKIGLCLTTAKRNKTQTECVIIGMLCVLCLINSLRPSDAYSVGNLTIIGADNGLSPGRRQAIIWTNAGILLIGPLGANFSEIFIEFLAFSFKKMRFKVSSAKWRPFCLGLNGLLTQACLNDQHVMCYSNALCREYV